MSLIDQIIRERELAEQDRLSAELCLIDGNVFGMSFHTNSARTHERQADEMAKRLLNSYPPNHPGWGRLLDDVLGTETAEYEDRERYDFIDQ